MKVKLVDIVQPPLDTSEYWGKCCSVCGHQKPLDDFYRSQRSSDGYQPRCKICDNAKTSAWRMSHLRRHAENERASYLRRKKPTTPKPKATTTRLSDPAITEQRRERQQQQDESRKKAHTDALIGRMTVAEAALLLGLTGARIRQLIRTGILPAAQRFGRLTVLAVDVDMLRTQRISKVRDNEKT